MNHSQRIDYLDSVRGIASLMVVIYHFIGWRWEKETTYHIASMIFNGSDAVSFFFVLSGFVLSYKYFQKGASIDLKEYIIKRFFRIYPAYILTVLLICFYYNRHDLGLATLKDVFYHNSQNLWQELFLVKSVHKFYIPGWTLGVEMALSLLLPYFILAAKINYKYLVALILVSIYIGATHLSNFTMHFCLGMLLAFFYPQIRSYNFRESKFYSYRWLIALITFLMFSIRHIEKIFPFGDKIKSLLNYWQIDLFHITGFASFMILFFVINSQRVQKILNLKPLLFLGKISYSVYLCHWIIILYIMDHWSKWEAIFHNSTLLFFTMLLVTVFAAILFSTVTYYFVEKPFIEMGKKLFAKKNSVIVY